MKNPEGTCPVPSHAPRNAFNVRNGVGRGTRVLSGIRQEFTNFTVDDQEKISSIEPVECQNARISSRYEHEESRHFSMHFLFETRRNPVLFRPGVARGWRSPLALFLAFQCKYKGFKGNLPCGFLLFFQKNFSIKHGRSRPGHINKIFLAVPENLKVTAEQLHGNRLVLIYQSIQG